MTFNFFCTRKTHECKKFFCWYFLLYCNTHVLQQNNAQTYYKEMIVEASLLYLQNIVQCHIEDLRLKAWHACRATTRIMFFGPKAAETIQNVQFFVLQANKAQTTYIKCAEKAKRFSKCIFYSESNKEKIFQGDRNGRRMPSAHAS